VPRLTRTIYARLAWAAAAASVALMAIGAVSASGVVEDIGRVLFVPALYFTGWVVGSGHVGTAVRRAVSIADGPDVSDWQRGYRACADRALYALGDRRRTAATRKCPDCTADVGEPHSPVCQEWSEQRKRRWPA
jgi:hypothetical protein